VNDPLSPTQSLVLFKLLFTNETPLQSQIQPKLSPKQREELVSLGLIRLEPATGRRGKRVTLTDKAWSWASESLECKLIVSQSATAVLEAVLRRLSGFLHTRSLNLADFFDASDRVESPAPPQPTKPDTSAPSVSVQEQIRRAYLALSEGRFNEMIRLADLKQALPNIPSQVVDEELLSMQRRGDVSLQTIESMQQTTEADRRAAITILGEDRNILYLEK
jgi:hypothetical protein